MKYDDLDVLAIQLFLIIGALCLWARCSARAIGKCCRRPMHARSEDTAVTTEEREQHMRRMIEHGEKVQDQFRRDNAEFEESCKRFWKFMQSADVRDLFDV